MYVCKETTHSRTINVGIYKLGKRAQFGNSALLKKKKINIMSPQVPDVKFYKKACRFVIMVCQLHLNKSVKRLLQLRQHNCSVNCPSLILIYWCHFHLSRGEL